MQTHLGVVTLPTHQSQSTVATYIQTLQNQENSNPKSHKTEKSSPPSNAVPQIASSKNMYKPETKNN